MQISSSVVQSRITVAGFTITLFAFTTGTLLTYSSLAKVTIANFGWIYLPSIFAITIGFTFSISAILFFLQAQRINDKDSSNERQIWFFCIGQILLYLSISQFLSSGVENLFSALYNTITDKHINGFSGYYFLYLIAVFILIAWWSLLLLAPVHFIRYTAFSGLLGAYRKRNLLFIIYFVLLMSLWLAYADIAFIEHEGKQSFYIEFIKQIAQPILELFK